MWRLGAPARSPRAPAILSLSDALAAPRRCGVGPPARAARRAILCAVAAVAQSLSHPHLRRRSSKPGLGAGPTPELRRLSVERAELESTKEGRKVYVKKSGLFFLSSKQEALDLNAAKQDAAVAAAAAAMDLADADPGES